MCPLSNGCIFQVVFNEELHIQAFNNKLKNQVASKGCKETPLRCLDYTLELMSRIGREFIIRILKLLHIDRPFIFNSVFVLDANRPGWSSWSDFGPCSSNCKKTRQRFCASSNKNRDCPGQSLGVESQEVVCPFQECNG